MVACKTNLSLDIFMGNIPAYLLFILHLHDYKPSFFNLFAVVSALLAPAAAAGALGYGYMWWKVRFLLYVSSQA